MKKLVLLLSIVTLFGCNDFLDEVDQDKLIPQDTDHYAALMLYEFNYRYPIFRTVDYMTDNIEEDAKATTNVKDGSKTTYTWQREIEIDEDGDEISTINIAWQNMYEDVAIVNYVIEQIDEATGTQEEINYTKGEAYFIRALSYFNLLNLYGQPYNASNANVALGVPIRDNIGVELTYSRNTVAECYAFIEADLQQAIDLITASNGPVSKWHPDLNACNLLMSRIKLYQKKWDEAITYADAVINEKSLSKLQSNVPFVREDNQEILFSYYTASPLFQLYSGTSASTTVTSYPYRANANFVSLYDDNDLRKEGFFLAVSDGTGRYYYLTKKYQSDLYTTLGYANFRVAEAYLNRAEAYAQTGNVANAVNDIKKLHAVRYSNTSSVVYPTAQDETLAFVLEERRKELCFEDHHRWFDLRRMDNQPVIKHVFTLIEDNGSKTGTETYTLLANDLNYTLPIPLKERQNNPLIRNNERYEKLPQIDAVISANTLITQKP